MKPKTKKETQVILFITSKFFNKVKVYEGFRNKGVQLFLTPKQLSELSTYLYDCCKVNYSEEVK